MKNRRTADEGASTRSDRRLATRVAASVPIDLVFADGESRRARSRDLGTGGACVETDDIPGSLESVVIQLPQGPVEASAEIRWQSPALHQSRIWTGVRLLEPAPEVTDSLWEFVHMRAYELARFLHEDSELRDLDVSEAFEISLLTRLLELSKDETVFEAGSRGPLTDALYLIFRGEVLIESEAGVLLGRFGTGRLFGGLPLAADIAPVNTVTTSRDSLLLQIDLFGFRHLERSKPLLARQVVATISAGHARLLEAVCRLLPNPQAPAPGRTPGLERHAG